MIRLTRLNGQGIVVNAAVVETLEATPDTVICLTNGQKLAVLESLDEVIDRVIEYQRRIRQERVSNAAGRLRLATGALEKPEDQIGLPERVGGDEGR